MRALLSVYDKTGLLVLARGLDDLGWTLLASAGTARAIAEAGIAVLDVAEYTGSPAILGHRVVTLHPKIHGGILADRDDPEHRADLDAHQIDTIDLVVGNLYPFRANPSVEMIDIGGPAMLRAAAKNHEHVGVVVDPADYSEALAEIADGGELRPATRRRLARKAFAHTAAYDAAIVSWLDQSPRREEDDTRPTAGGLTESLHLTLVRAERLRYGENPHQAGARYRYADGDGWWDSTTQHHGKNMSYLNVLDVDAAWQLCHALGEQATAAVIKHANPCGVASHENIVEAYGRAHRCDPVSAFGGIVALNREVPLALAEALSDVFTEVIIAPSYNSDALAKLREKKNLRVLEAPPPVPTMFDMRSIAGGMLVQTVDNVSLDRDNWTVPTDRMPSDSEWVDLEFAWCVAARVSSNCIVLVADQQAVGIGAGQQNRRDAARIATEKAAGRAEGGACASDAFFPFRDGLDAAIDAGCTAVIQPGGSIRDQEVIDAANEAGMAMVFTGERHFRH